MTKPHPNHRAPCDEHPDESGSATIEFVLVSVALLVPLVYVLVAVFTVQRSTYGIEHAAQEAARGFVAASSTTLGAAQARTAADLALKDQGVDPRTVTIGWTCQGGCLQPGSTITVRVDAVVVLPGAPAVLGHALASIPVHAEHTEAVDTYQGARS